jgi:HEPN domain-containing protein
MKPNDVAGLLLSKARDDEALLKLIVRSRKVKDELFGFHVQQAAEKLLKAVMASRKIRYRYTHDLVELLDTIRENGIDIPPEAEEIRAYTPFAVEYRYDYLPAEDEAALDRKGALALLMTVRKWAEKVVRNVQRGKPSDDK